MKCCLGSFFFQKLPCKKVFEKCYFYLGKREGIILQTNSTRPKKVSLNCVDFIILKLIFKSNIDPTKSKGQRLVGDVDYSEAKKVASFITPVPGFMISIVCY
jgi:hypothetical protein